MYIAFQLKLQALRLKIHRVRISLSSPKATEIRLAKQGERMRQEEHGALNCGGTVHFVPTIDEGL